MADGAPTTAGEDRRRTREEKPDALVLPRVRARAPIRPPLGGRPRGGPGLSLAPGDHRGRLYAGRDQRSGRAHDRRTAQCRMGPVRHRGQPLGRRRQYRGGLCGPRAARRLYADGRHRRDDDHQRVPLQERTVRSGEGFFPRHLCRGEHHLSRGQHRISREFRGGCDRLCQGQSRQAPLRLVRRRLAAPSCGRAPAAEDRHRHRPCALSRRRGHHQ